MISAEMVRDMALARLQPHMFLYYNNPRDRMYFIGHGLGANGQAVKVIQTVNCVCIAMHIHRHRLHRAGVSRRLDRLMIYRPHPFWVHATTRVQSDTLFEVNILIRTRYSPALAEAVIGRVARALLDA
jgi:hypothetical protein